MMLFHKTFFLACSVLICWLPAIASAQNPDISEFLERLQRLEERQAQYEKALDAKDTRIRELEAELAADHKNEAGHSPQNGGIDSAEPVLAKEEEHTSSLQDKNDVNPFNYTPGKGYTVGRSDIGELNLSLFSYIRYLNQGGLDGSYVNHFGVEENIDKRNDMSINKVMLYSSGWFLDPKLNYLFYLWGSASALGTSNGTLVAGYITYTFNDAFKLGAGVVALPTSRTMDGNFPLWHRVDNRLLADEFMRGSFTQGIWASGKIGEKANYNISLGNNLSSFGVASVKLDDIMNTVSTSLTWMPSTGEFGPRASIGDYEYHTELATLFGIHYTFSTEDKQSQPNQNDPENTQIRLSSGVTLFTPEALAPDTTVDKLDYHMVSLNAGMKYKGFALEGDVFYRYLNNFKTNIPLDIDHLSDQGVALRASTMAIPQTLQLYVNGSKVFGEYGDPWDAGLGFNWWPFKKRGLRLNSEAIYMKDSPVGASSLPYTVGATGWVFVSNLELIF